MDKETNTGADQTTTTNSTLQKPEMLETRMAKATLHSGDQSQDISFRLVPEVPSMSAASAIAEVRKTLKKFLKPEAVSKIADEVITMLEEGKDKTIADVMKKVIPMLQSVNLQQRLYGNVLRVSGNQYVEETLEKELKGVSMHLAVVFEAVKEDPLMIARFLPYLTSDSKKASPSGKKGGSEFI